MAGVQTFLVYKTWNVSPKQPFYTGLSNKKLNDLL
jgi:hypothetical protein